MCAPWFVGTKFLGNGLAIVADPSGDGKTLQLGLADGGWKPNGIRS